ncbi:MAG: UDP-3-O-(3-hydroxymyristoyl)glucosamine N-acyltransferase [Ferruginibacter sp.]|nr:UDP-3-O-(3-hydroxymyristoyl)glucosamine N-acyltransferase [Cytophagales bacterium]
MEFTVADIARRLGGEVRGEGSLRVRQLAKIEEAREGSLSFLSNPKYEPALYTTQASAVLVGRNFEPTQEVRTTLIAVEDPYLAFTQLLEEYMAGTGGKTGVEQPSFLAEGATVGEHVYRGAFSYVGQHCRIGNYVEIHPHAYLGDHVRIGDHTVIHAGARIGHHTHVGRHCVIQMGAVLGSDGFGFAPQPDGTYRPIPQVGNVVLEDYVHVGANTTVDRATLGSTILRSGVKLDNLIQIAHNVEVGRNTVVAAQSGVSGSTKVGENCVLAGQVGLVGHITLADRTQVGAQSGVGKSVKQPGTLLGGSPAFNYKDNLRSLAVFRKLPDLEKRVTDLEEKTINLPGN